MTISKFQASQKPPSRVSHDDVKTKPGSDDDLLELTAFDDFGTGEQYDDDLATLNDLASELASSIGRLTRCSEQDFHLVR